MEDSTKKALMAVGVGVGATGLVATAMYFLSGREMPKLPSLSEVGELARREVLFGASSQNVKFGKELEDHLERVASLQKLPSPRTLYGKELEDYLQWVSQLKGT